MLMKSQFEPLPTSQQPLMTSNRVAALIEVPLNFDLGSLLGVEIHMDEQTFLAGEKGEAWVLRPTERTDVSGQVTWFRRGSEAGRLSRVRVEVKRQLQLVKKLKKKQIKQRYIPRQPVRQ